VVATPARAVRDGAIARKSFALAGIPVKQEGVRGGGPPYLWTYRVSLTGVTAILARLAGRRSERMPGLAQQPDRRFALVCR
jgi:hypothetical protein